MSKSITVPDIGMYPIRLEINNKNYELIPGSTQTVPDEVAALLGQVIAAKPQTDQYIADKQYATLGQVKDLISAGGGSDLPDVTVDDNGKILGVSAGSWEKIDAPSGLPAVTGDDNGKVLGVNNGSWEKSAAPVTPFEISGVLSESNGISAVTITGKTAAELYQLCSGGRPCLMHLDVGEAIMDVTCHLESMKMTVGETDYYGFVANIDKRYSSAENRVGADDNVVLMTAFAQQVFRVPFTLTLDQTTGDLSASTTASFSAVHAAFVAGAVIVADGALTMGSLTTRLCGVVSGAVGEGYDSLSVCIPSKKGFGYGAYNLIWSSDGTVTPDDVNFQTQT